MSKRGGKGVLGDRFAPLPGPLQPPASLRLGKRSWRSAHTPAVPHRRGISNTAGTLAGVVGVAATGVLLESAGGAGVLAGWYAALAVAASLCLAGSFAFLWHARGERLFGGDATRL